MMNRHDCVTFGRISACIDGDARYTSTVRVELDAYAGNVIITRRETVPHGGMDTIGSALDDRPLYAATVPCDLARILREVRKAFDDTIRRYGKPTRRFRWGCSSGALTFGLNRVACTNALFEAMDRADVVEAAR